MHVISVAPTEGGWMVEADVLAAPLLFNSGGKAEEAAKRLGEGLAKAGRWGEIRIHLAGGELLGRFICPPQPVRAKDPGPRIGGFEGKPAWLAGRRSDGGPRLGALATA